MFSRSRLSLIVLVTVLLIATAALAAASANPERNAMPAPTAPRPPELAQGAAPLDTVERYTTGGVDVDALVAQDLIREAAGGPVRFAQPIPAALSPATNGTWETLADGTRLWRLRISSPKAVSLNLGFGRYHMPDGGRLYLYTPDYAVLRGPFTSANNQFGELWTPLLPGDEIVVEVALPAAVANQLDLALTSINHGYRAFSLTPTSGACNVDVVCPQGDPWREEIRSVAALQLGGSYICTGFMVNNAAQDLTPYFMTANHCGVNAGNAASLVAYWNYENSTCRPPGSPASGGPGDGQLNQFTTGSTFKASYSASDFTLVQLSSAPDPSYDVYWAGWDATSADPTSATAIHHPQVEEKRISFEYDPTSTTSYLGTTSPGDGTHIRITDWDVGTTEPGSSGSPLFNQNHHIVGQLHGGYAACGNDLSDWYGRFSVSWNGGGATTNSLKPWLDPANTGILVLDGRGLYPDFTVDATPAQAAICAGSDATYNVDIGQRTGFSETVTLSALGVPSPATAGFNPNPVTPPGSSTLTVGNTAGVAAGQYNIEVRGTSSTLVHTDTVVLNVSTTTPGTPVLTSPANGALNVPPQPAFTWSAASQAATYDLEIATDPSFSNIVHTAIGLTGTSYSGATLNTSTTYYWRVRANNGCGVGAYSEVWSFTTQAAPGDCGPGTAAHIVYSTDFEAGAGGWTHSAAVGTDTWAISTANPHSGSNAFHADDLATVSDQRLVSPPVVLPTGWDPLTFKFWNYQNMETRTGGCYDGGIIEVTSDGGSTWTQVPNANLLTDPYDGPISASFSNPLANLDAWCGNNPQPYLNSIVDVSSYAGQTVQFRLRLGTDNSVSRPGWDIDDVVVQACPAVPTSVEVSSFRDGGAVRGTPWWSVLAAAVLAVAAAWMWRRRVLRSR